MVKGCIQLGLIPNINNTVNMVPVDHITLYTSLVIVSPLLVALLVMHMHITIWLLPIFNSMLSSLIQYSFHTKHCKYLVWQR